MIFYSCAMFCGYVGLKISSAVGRMWNGDIGACCQFAVECSFVGELIVGLSLFTGYGLSHNTMGYSCLHLLDSKKGIRFVRSCLSNYLLNIKLVKKKRGFLLCFLNLQAIFAGLIRKLRHGPYQLKEVENRSESNLLPS